MAVSQQLRRTDPCETGQHGKVHYRPFLHRFTALRLVDLHLAGLLSRLRLLRLGFLHRLTAAGSKGYRQPFGAV